MMLGFLGPGASPKGCLGWVHRRRVQVMLHGVCPVNGEKPEAVQGLTRWGDGWAGAGHAPHTHPTQQPGMGGLSGTIRTGVVQENRSEAGSGAALQVPTLPVQCPWWGAGHEAPLQLCTVIPSWAGFARQQDTGSHGWSPACCGAARYWSRGPFRMLLRVDEPWWALGRVVHPSHGVLDPIVCSRVYGVAAYSSPCV